ncbi:mesothelin [Pelobates fuscus]|uniref:mesothelin n=1 Tax=Pelobates fuscus TaxID=191477 RepID=UPI002FE46030
MVDPLKFSLCLLIFGLLTTLTSAANTCNVTTVNETETCKNTKSINYSDLCNLTFTDYACLSTSQLSILPSDILVTLSACYSNTTVLALNPGLSTLFFTKLASDQVKLVLSPFDAKSSSLKPEWMAFLLNGIQSLIMQDLKNTQNISGPSQPFLPFANASIIECLQSQNATCELFQKLVQGLGQNYNNMPVSKRQEIYPAIKSFLLNQKNKTGSACAVNGSSSAWIMQNIGHFSMVADFNDFFALNANITALEVLPFLSLPQLANVSVNPSLVNSTMVSGVIVGLLQNKNDVYSFLVYLNASLNATNQSSLNPILSQALLNKTFQIYGSNTTSFNNTELSQLLQNQLNFAITNVTLDQLSLIPPNISCQFFQAVIKGLNVQYPNLKPDKQQEIFKSLIKPYLTQKGAACAVNVNSTTWVNQNLGSFSHNADSMDFNGLNANFNSLEAVSVLTTSQVVGFVVNSGLGNTTNSSNIIVGTLQNKTDVFNFLNSLNGALTASNQSSISSPLSQALFNKTLQVLWSNITSFTSSDWAQLLQKDLKFALPSITGEQLTYIPQNITCSSYQTILQTFNAQFSNMSAKSQEQVYNSMIKPYLTQKGNMITCYNQTDANSTAWFVTNMGSFFTYTSKGDLALFANSTIQQVFANDPSAIQLASQLNLNKDTATYYTSLLSSSPNFNVSKLPNKFLCYVNPSAFQKLSSDGALSLTVTYNNQCRPSASGNASSTPTTEEVQAAVSLVSKLDTFSSSTLSNLGASAVGLSQSQISTINGTYLAASLPTLSNVSGWNDGQSRSIVRQLLNSGYQINDLQSLGSLVSGLPSSRLQALDPALVVNSLKSSQFVNQLSSAPSTLKNVFVNKLVAANSTPTSLVKNVPSSLASFVPKSLLVYKSETPVIQDLNEKAWTSDQAAMFFDQVVVSQTNFTQLSSSVLQGFTCGTPSKLNSSQIKDLAKAMKIQNAKLGEQQLNCLTRQVTKSGVPTDLDKYPKEILLYISPSNYTSGSCVDYFTNVGKANISVLPKGSTLRTSLLTQALACLNVTNASLTDANVNVLGQLACDLNTSYTDNASNALLNQLSQCSSLSADQQTSILSVIAKGNTQFGSPTNWTQTTLTSLGSLNTFLNSAILTKVPSGVITSWMTGVIQNSTLSKKQITSIVKNLYPLRTRRAASCPDGMQITADNVTNSLLPLLYTTDQLEACLNYTILVAYLSSFTNMPFTDEQLAVLKNKLDQAYPNGYPETVIPDLGSIAFLCTASDIAKWNITSVDMLASLLQTGPTDSQAAIYIGKYTDSAQSINGLALNAISSNYICLLTSTQLNLITAAAISEAQPLTISSCNQNVKDALYLKANVSFQNYSGQIPAFYNLMKPYLGGAPAADLKLFAKQNVSMDIGTFTSLKQSSVMSLTVDDVLGLLGSNIADLKAQQNNTVISAWIQAQKQSDLDRLGLGIQGGIRDSANSTVPTTTKKTTVSSAPRSKLLFHSIFFCIVMTYLLS